MPRLTAAAPAKAPLPLGVRVLAAGTFLMGTTEFVVAGLLPELATDFGTSEAGAGLTITVFAIGMILGAPAVPLLTLRLPRRATLVLSLALYSAAHVIAALTRSLPVLLAARFGAGVATGSFWALAAVAAAGLVGPQRRSTALGVVLGGGMLANVVGVPLGAVCGQLIGWRAPFWGLATLAAVAAVAVARWVPGQPAHSPIPSLRSELGSLQSGRLWLVLATCAAVTASVLSVYSFVSPVLVGRAGMPASMVPLTLALFGAGAFVGNIMGGRLGDRHGLAVAAATAVAILIATITLCVFSTMVVPSLVAFALLGLVGLSANPVLVALALRYGGDDLTLPSAMSTSMFNLGTAVGTGLTGVLLGTPLGSLSPPLVGVVFAALILVPVCALQVVHTRCEGADVIARCP